MQTKLPKNVRLDDWAVVSNQPTSIPFELKPKGSVFRGMSDLTKAKAYADLVSEWFSKHGDETPTAYVVKGPTSTTAAKFEVVDATCGYPVVYAAKPHQVLVKERLDALPQLARSAGASYTLSVVAAQAIRLAGNAAAVNWEKVELDVIEKSIGECGQHPSSVLAVLSDHSPGAIGEDRKEELLQLVWAQERKRRDVAKQPMEEVSFGGRR